MFLQISQPIIRQNRPEKPFVPRCVASNPKSRKQVYYVMLQSGAVVTPVVRMHSTGNSGFEIILRIHPQP